MRSIDRFLLVFLTLPIAARFATANHVKYLQGFTDSSPEWGADQQPGYRPGPWCPAEQHRDNQPHHIQQSCACGMTNYDAIIIGTGQAGPPLARRLAGAGMRVAIVERKFFGGTCVNTGCIPTKAMVASAYAAHLAQRAADYGIAINGSISTDMKAVKARKDAIAEESRIAVETSLKGMQNCTVYQNHARFESPKALRVGNELLSSDRFFINVGGRAVVPSLPGVNEVPYLTNSSMMAVDFLPRHLVIVGGSYVGLEFGQMFRRFGSEVTIVEKGPHLIGREDEDISKAIDEILRQEGIDVRLNSKCIGFRPHPDGVAVTAECTEGSPEVVGSHVLLAVGR